MNLESLKKSARSELEQAKTAEDIEKVRVRYLGREKGKLTAILRSLKDLPLEKRKKIGPQAQTLKTELAALFKEKISKTYNLKPPTPVDLSVPGRRPARGRLHPLTLVDQEVRQIFTGMNFSVVEGPEVETEYYNFDALNIPPDHPAREAWDTFWLRSHRQIPSSKSRFPNKTYKLKNLQTNKLLLRTHTSPVQIRYMEKNAPPFQIIAPGRVFRYEATDMKHETNFYQLEGLMVGKHINLANFKFIVEEFLKKFFKSRKIDFRYRPSYFPFTEPSLEVDIKIEDLRGPSPSTSLGASADSRGKSQRGSASNLRKSAWLEIMGAGMVHPRVFEYAHYNPRDWQGFAFGVGLERLAMIKYRIPDIRLFHSGDLRFIQQF